MMEKLVSQSRGRERRREGRIGLGGKLVAQWGFLLEFNLSGWGRKRRRGGRERAGSAAVWNMCRLDVQTHSASLLKRWKAQLAAPRASHRRGLGYWAE